MILFKMLNEKKNQGTKKRVSYSIGPISYRKGIGGDKKREGGREGSCQNRKEGEPERRGLRSQRGSGLR